MLMGTEAPPSGALAASTASLDGLRADQDPETFNLCGPRSSYMGRTPSG